MHESFGQTFAFNLVKVSKLVDESGSLVQVSGNVVTMRIHSLMNTVDSVMIRYVIELEGGDEPPFLVFTSTNSGVSQIYDKTDEIALEIWAGLFTQHDVFGYIVKFNHPDSHIFAYMFGRKFDELLSALSQYYFVTEMSRSSGGGNQN